MTEASARETLENLAPDNLNWYSEYTENREKKSRIKKIIIAAVISSVIGALIFPVSEQERGEAGE